MTRRGLTSIDPIISLTSEACSLETTAEVTAFLGTNSLKVYRFSIPFKLKQTNQKRKIEKNSSNKKMSRVQLAAH